MNLIFPEKSSLMKVFGNVNSTEYKAIESILTQAYFFGITASNLPKSNTITIKENEKLKAENILLHGTVKNKEKYIRVLKLKINKLINYKNGKIK